MSNKTNINNITDFYNGISSYYHLIYSDWYNSITKQAEDLDSIIKDYWKREISNILDASCGIGTQVLGLAQLGYNLTGSDISSLEIKRAKMEAKLKKLKINFLVADMRELSRFNRKEYDLVISCDNSLPHLLNDIDILKALRQFYKCTRSGGGTLISVRDYAKENFKGIQLKPYEIRKVGETKYIIYQVWEFTDNKHYNISIHFIEDKGTKDCKISVFRSKYYTITIDRLKELMKRAGFKEIKRINNKYFQPVLVGRKK